MRNTTENLGRFRFQLLVAAREWARLICAAREGERGPREVRVEHGEYEGLDDVVVITPLEKGAERKRRYQVKKQTTALSAGQLSTLFRSLHASLTAGENAEIVLAIQDLVPVDAMELRHLRALAARLSQPGIVLNEVLRDAYPAETAWVASLVASTGLTQDRILQLLSRCSVETLGTEAAIEASIEDALRHWTRDRRVAAGLLLAFVTNHPDGAIRFDLERAEAVLDGQWKDQAASSVRRVVRRSWLPEQDALITQAPWSILGVTAPFAIASANVRGACTAVMPGVELADVRDFCAQCLGDLSSDPRTSIAERSALISAGAAALADASAILRERAAHLIRDRQIFVYAAISRHSATTDIDLVARTLTDRLTRKKDALTGVALPATAAAISTGIATRFPVSDSDPVLLAPILLGVLLARAVLSGEPEPGYALLRPKMRLLSDLDTGANLSRHMLP